MVEDSVTVLRNAKSIVHMVQFVAIKQFPPRTWFFEIALVRTLVCVCVCVRP